MPAVLSSLRVVHRILAREAFYALVLSSSLAIGLLFARGYMSRARPYSFLVWDLLLAWAPYVVSLWLVAQYRVTPARPYQLVMPSMVWLILFPNASYLLTEFVQLREITPPAWIWYDLGLLAAFAFTGYYLTVTSLHSMRRLVKMSCGGSASWCFVVVTLLLTGLGVYLGRFLRWNSWDIILNPGGILTDVVTRFADPLNHIEALGFSVVFAVLLFVCYIIFTGTRQSQQGRVAP